MVGIRAIVALVTYGLRRALAPEEEAGLRQALLSLLFKYPFSL
jgi:hypothetical protein